MTGLLTRTAKSAKGKHALTLLGVLGVFLASAVVFAATRGGDFKLSVSGANQTVTGGKSASYTVKVKRVRGFKGAVKLGVKGLPRGTRVSWGGGKKKKIAVAAAASTLKKNVNSATLTIVTTGTSPVGSFNPTITAKSGKVEHSKKVKLTIKAPVVTGQGGTGVVGGGPATTTTQGSQSETSGQPFTVAGSPAGVLSLGVTQQMNLTVDNPNDFAIQVTGLNVAVNPTGNAGCPVSGNFTVTQIGTASPISVPAHSGPTSLTALGVNASALPRVTMTNSAQNQNPCKGLSLSFTYSGNGAQQ
jgi:hypothetical protein